MANDRLIGSSAAKWPDTADVNHDPACLVLDLRIRLSGSETVQLAPQRLTFGGEFWHNGVVNVGDK